METFTSRSAANRVTISLCLAVALLEGVDLQSAGVAGPGIASEFALSVKQMGFAFSAGAFGLLPGAAIGGRLADWFGRKRVLLTSVVLFGLFSLATTQVWDFHSLLVARVLTGLGLGAAMPNLIALCSEAAGENRRSSAVGAMYCGMPFGGAIAALVGALWHSPAQWRAVFYLGGFGPVVVALLLALYLRESRQFEALAGQAAASKQGFVNALWRHERALTTSALWVAYLGTLIVLYFLMNWLPSMVIGRGLTHAQGEVVLVAFNVGAGLGAFGLGRLMDRIGHGRTVSLMYAGIAIALTVLAAASGIGMTVVGGFLCGMFVVGGQGVLYALAGLAYPTEVRGTGVGSAVAVGRLGSIIGPLAAGFLFTLGSSASMLVGASIPVIVVAALAALIVVRRFRVERAAAPGVSIGEAL